MSQVLNYKKAVLVFMSLLIVLPAFADERIDRNSYQIVPGEIYHVLSAVRWIDGEGGSYLFHRLDGKENVSSWYVDFLENDEGDGYVWPENCFIGIIGNVPVSDENRVGEDWLRRHDALLFFRDSYPVSGYDIKVTDALGSASLEEAGPLVANLAYLFKAPMMRGEGLSWICQNEYDPDTQTIILAVSLNTPYGVVANWKMEYRRHAGTESIEKLKIQVSSSDPFSHEEAPPGAYESLDLASALEENFNNLFLERLYNYLNIFYTEKWPAYTLNYPDARVMFNRGETGGGSFYSFTLL